MNDTQTAIAKRVDIATDDRLGQRVSALHYARVALLNESKGSIFGPTGSKVESAVADLLKVGDWLLDDTHPYGDDEDTEEAGPSDYIVIRRPRWFGDPITAAAVRDAHQQWISSDPPVSAEQQIFSEVSNRVYVALREAEATEESATNDGPADD